MDDVLVEEVDGGPITKHKPKMDHIIDSDLSTSSMDIGVNNLLDSLVVENPPKGNHTLVHYDEGLGKKGDETFPLVVYEEKKVLTVIQEDSIVEKNGEVVNLLQIETTKSCHLSREEPHNYNARMLAGQVRVGQVWKCWSRQCSEKHRVRVGSMSQQFC